MQMPDLTREQIDHAKRHAAAKSDVTTHTLLTYIEQLEAMLFDMAGLTDWLREGYTIDAYNEFCAMVEARREDETDEDG